MVKRSGALQPFVNKKYRNKGDNLPVGGIGFFDCINDQDAADMLFDVSKHPTIAGCLNTMGSGHFFTRHVLVWTRKKN